MSIKKLSVVVVAILSISTAMATDYYVSKEGADTNAGTEEAPFLTIAKASAVMVAGDVCIIKEGVYRETLTTTKSGTAASPLTYRAFEGDSVVVTATEPLTNWEVHNGPIYKTAATMSTGVRHRAIYVGGRAMEIARWPNDVDHNRYTIDTELVTGGTRAHIEAANILNVDWTGGYVWYLGGHSGASWTRPVTSVSTTRIDFNEVPDKWPFDPHNPGIVRNNNRGRFFLFGVLGALDFEEEWYYDASANMVYLYAPDGKDPNELSVEASSRIESMHLRGNYIEVDGITFFGGTAIVEGSNCVVRNSTITYGHQVLDELNNTNAQIGEGSVQVKGSDNLIERNLIEFSAGNGVMLGEAWKNYKGNTINNNIIRYSNTIGNHSSPIRSSQAEAKITNNTIYDTGRDGIYINGNNSETAYNDISRCVLINNDAGVFYVVGNANDKNSIIHHNWFHDSNGPAYADGRAAGIYLDNHSKGYVVHHNVVWDITWTGIQINWDNWNIDIYNNSIYEAEAAMGRWAGPNGTSYTIDDIVIKNNYANKVSEDDPDLRNGWIGTDVSTTNNVISETSPFVSLEDRNFSPVENSELIDKGIIIEGITDGFVGNLPDVGAYEYGADPWIAGADWEAYVIADVPAEEEEEEEEKEVLGLKRLETLFYPNPVVSEINFSIAIKGYQIIDGFGRVVAEHVPNQKIISIPSIDLSGLVKGMYFMNVLTENDEIKSQILIKR
ncbi:MAG: right-handed parallel beta-helix repeat-containing protein [Cyclobacteriaceae bacterium]